MKFFLLIAIFHFVFSEEGKRLESLSLLGTYNTPGEAYGLYIENHIAYVADKLSGLQIIDVSDPSAPFFLGSYSPVELVASYEVSVFNNIAYVADGLYGLAVINVAIPSSPSPIGVGYSTPSEAWGLFVTNDIAYVVASGAGLFILDISYPTTPSLIGVYDTPGYAAAIRIIDDIAYIADFLAGLQILNISNSNSPVLLGSCSTNGYAFTVSVSNGFAYIADSEAGLVVINVTDPSNPYIISNFSDCAPAYGVTVNEDIVYVANSDYGMWIYDVSDPSDPKLLEIYSHLGGFQDIVVIGDYLYIAGGPSGLLIFEVHYSSSSLTNLEDSSSLGLPTIIIFSFLTFLLCIFVFLKARLLHLTVSYFDVYYLLFAFIGLLNFVSDIMMIILYSSNNIIFFVTSLSVFILSFFFGYFRTNRWRQAVFKRDNESLSDFEEYYSNNQNIFNIIVYLSILISPEILFILKCNIENFQFPISGYAVSIPIQCIIYDVYSLLPQSIIFYFFLFQTPLNNWNTFLWLILFLKLLNQIIGISRVTTVSYFGGGKGKLKTPKMKFGVFSHVIAKKNEDSAENHSSSSIDDSSQIELSPHSETKNSSSFE